MPGFTCRLPRSRGGRGSRGEKDGEWEGGTRGAAGSPRQQSRANPHDPAWLRAPKAVLSSEQAKHWGSCPYPQCSQRESNPRQGRQIKNMKLAAILKSRPGAPSSCGLSLSEGTREAPTHRGEGSGSRRARWGCRDWLQRPGSARLRQRPGLAESRRQPSDEPCDGSRTAQSLRPAAARGSGTEGCLEIRRCLSTFCQRPALGFTCCVAANDPDASLRAGCSHLSNNSVNHFSPQMVKPRKRSGLLLWHTRGVHGQRSRPLSPSQNDRITESFRLEKTSQIIKSNCHANTPMPAKPCPEVPHPHVF